MSGCGLYLRQIVDVHHRVLIILSIQHIQLVCVVLHSWRRGGEGERREGGEEGGERGRGREGERREGEREGGGEGGRGRGGSVIVNDLYQSVLINQ